jgi:hypothetical protein
MYDGSGCRGNEIFEWDSFYRMLFCAIEAEMRLGYDALINREVLWSMTLGAK